MAFQACQVRLRAHSSFQIDLFVSQDKNVKTLSSFPGQVLQDRWVTQDQRDQEGLKAVQVKKLFLDDLTN